MDFFVRKESDSELLIGIKIYVFRKKYGDMFGNIYILQGYVCMIIVLNSIDNQFLLNGQGICILLKYGRLIVLFKFLRFNGISLNVLGKYFVVQYVICLIFVVNLSQLIGLYICIMECLQVNEGGCFQILYEICCFFFENVN